MNVSFKTTPHITLRLTRQGVTSGASRNTWVFKKYFALEVRHKKLSSRTKWNSGRSSTTGRVILRTQGHRSIKPRNYSINYSLRDRHVSMVASITFSPSLNKLLSLVMFASGAYSYVVTTTKHRLFHFVRLQSSLWRKSFLTRYLSTYIKTVDITQGWYVLHQLPKNQPISLLELVPERGVQYTRAAGSKATMLKMDSRVGTGLVRLPSGVKKIFSIYAVASLGSVALPESRRCLTANAGFYRRKGRKPMVRGVAKNPVDHPHGGRTKTIANPRTPWGLPTKLK